MKNVIAFPDLGLEFNVNATAFYIDKESGFGVQWYGIILSLGIILAFLTLYYLATKKELIDADTVYNVTLLTVPIGIVGARFFYVATEWDQYKDGSFLDMINIRNGGIAIYGAIIFGLATVLIYCKVKKMKAFALLDALAPAVMIGQIVGRWGNFINGEAFGFSENVGSFPWRMTIEKYNGDVLRFTTATNYPDGVHPTFLYESLWNFIGLAIIIFVLYRKKKFNGEIFFAYMGWYGFGRMFIEMLRTDSLFLFKSIFGQTFKFSVVTGAVCFIAAVIGLVVLSRRYRSEKEEISGYTSTFSSLAVKIKSEEDALDQSVFDTAEPEEAAEKTEESDVVEKVNEAPEELEEPEEGESNEVD